LNAEEKLRRLEEWFSLYESVLVAFSGGVDSAVIAAVAKRSLGKDRVLAVTINSSIMPKRELLASKKVAREIGVKHMIVEEDELKDERFATNPENRCYYCRSNLARVLKKIARERGIPVIVDGTHLGDTLEHRPGLKALREHGIRSPLMELGYGKKDVREIAKLMGLSVKDKPAMACLASRIPYGERITADKLRRIEKAEDSLLGMGFRTVRVRAHGNIARIEVLPEELSRALELREKIVRELKDLGFIYITLDLQGYRPGSMDEELNNKKNVRRKKKGKAQRFNTSSTMGLNLS